MVDVRVVFLLAAFAAWASCSAGSDDGGTKGASGGNSASTGGGSGRAGTGGVTVASGGVGGAAGAITGSAAGGGSVGAAGRQGAGGRGGGAAGTGDAVGSGGTAGGGGAGGRPPTTGAGGAAGGSNDCGLPATVSFQKDVQPFLIKSCGSSGSDGCHVIDAASTMSSGGWDHAYDWITAGAHASSCPEKPTPLRFQVVIAVIDQPDPPSCSKSRQMPPPNATGGGLRAPLTTCQVATLAAWLDEPLVTQTHRADDSSPTTPYPMPPFN
jgi:hypothetical protein